MSDQLTDKALAELERLPGIDCDKDRMGGQLCLLKSRFPLSQFIAEIGERSLPEVVEDYSLECYPCAEAVQSAAYLLTVAPALIADARELRRLRQPSMERNEPRHPLAHGAPMSDERLADEQIQAAWINLLDTLTVDDADGMHCAACHRGSPDGAMAIQHAPDCPVTVFDALRRLRQQIAEQVDDGEPVTEEWLRSKGLSDCSRFGHAILATEAVRVSECLTRIEFWNSGSIAIVQGRSSLDKAWGDVEEDEFDSVAVPVATRGQFCDIASALGIPLRQSAAALDSLLGGTEHE